MRQYPSLYTHAPRNPIKWIKWLWKNHKWARQRVKRGYADCDVWELYGFIETVIENGLRQLADKHESIPQSFFEQANCDEELASKNYANYLNETANLFAEAINESNDPNCWSTEAARRQLALHRAFHRLEKVFFDLWD